MNITLQEDNELLDEVVVIGYGSVKRKDVTTKPYLRFLQRIWTNAPLYRQPKPYKAKQPACRLCNPAVEPGGGMSIRVRGTTSFNGSNDPLYVVDGVPVDNINFLSPTTLKTLYSEGCLISSHLWFACSQRVVLITTKAGSEGNAKVALNVQYGMTKVGKAWMP